MAFLPAGFVDGSMLPGEVLRRLAYAATKGETAVLLPTDLKVEALGVPAAAVSVNTGTGIVLSRFPNVKSQTYVIANDAAVTVPVPTAAGDYFVYAAIRDPQYPGQSTPAAPLTDTYTDVRVTTTYPDKEPYIPLARIANPSGASTITAGMITDLRSLGAPRSSRETEVFYPTMDLTMSKSAYTNWPRIIYSVAVPTWATKLTFIAHINGVAYTGTGDAVAGVRGYFGPYPSTQNGILGARGVSRQSLAVLSTWTVPLAIRGTTVQLALQGYQTAGAGNFTADYQSQVLFDYSFTEGSA